MKRFTQSFSSEFRKIVAVKTWWVLALVLAIYSAFIAGMFGVLFGDMGEQLGSGAALDPQVAADMVYSSVSSFGYVIPLLLGGLAVTSEIRHRTLGLAFVAEPRRGLVLFTKSLVIAAFGAVTGIIGLIGAVGAGALTLEATGGEAMLATGDTWGLLGRVVVVIALWSVIGLGIGLVVGNQAAAIVIALVFTQFVEPILRVAAPFWDWSASIAKFFPGSATDAFVGASLMNNLGAVDPQMGSTADSLGIGGGLAVLIAYSLVLLLIGWVVRLRRDLS